MNGCSVCITNWTKQDFIEFGIDKASPIYSYANFNIISKKIIFYILFRGEITPLSSSYNISGLVPMCWLPFLMLLTETSRGGEKLIILTLSALYSKS